MGAGPGAPDLITLRGERALRTADVVVYDALAPPELLEFAPAGAERINVGKRGHDPPTRSQEEITELLVELARAGKTVVRLKGGDPFVFGRGSEEATACFDAGIPFEVVPGVTSSIAALAYAGIPGDGPEICGLLRGGDRTQGSHPRSRADPLGRPGRGGGHPGDPDGDEQPRGDRRAPAGGRQERRDARRGGDGGDHAAAARGGGAALRAGEARSRGRPRRARRRGGRGRGELAEIPRLVRAAPAVRKAGPGHPDGGAVGLLAGCAAGGRGGGRGDSDDPDRGDSRIPGDRRRLRRARGIRRAPADQRERGPPSGGSRRGARQRPGGASRGGRLRRSGHRGGRPGGGLPGRPGPGQPLRCRGDAR